MSAGQAGGPLEEMGSVVLTLTIPVAEAAKPRRIEITTGGGHPVVEGSAQDPAAISRA